MGELQARRELHGRELRRGHNDVDHVVPAGAVKLVDHGRQDRRARVWPPRSRRRRGTKSPKPRRLGTGQPVRARDARRRRRLALHGRLSSIIRTGDATGGPRSEARLAVGASFAWCFLAAAPLIVGGAVALQYRVGERTLGLVMAFGSGVLISAVAFELVQEAWDREGAHAGVALGLFAGSLTFWAGDAVIDRRGGAHRSSRAGVESKAPRSRSCSARSSTASRSRSCSD